MYNARYAFTERITSVSTVLPSIRTRLTLLGCSASEISRPMPFNKSRIRDTLIPPPVLPAQAPTHISVTRIVLEKPGHWLKSTVLNPVVVMIDPT